MQTVQRKNLIVQKKSGFLNPAKMLRHILISLQFSCLTGLAINDSPESEEMVGSVIPVSDFGLMDIVDSTNNLRKKSGAAHHTGLSPYEAQKYVLNNLNSQEQLKMDNVLDDITHLYEKLPKPLQVVAAPNFGSLIRTMHTIKESIQRAEIQKALEREIKPKKKLRRKKKIASKAQRLRAQVADPGYPISVVELFDSQWKESHEGFHEDQQAQEQRIDYSRDRMDVNVGGEESTVEVNDKESGPKSASRESRKVNIEEMQELQQLERKILESFEDYGTRLESPEDDSEAVSEGLEDLKSAEVYSKLRRSEQFSDLEQDYQERMESYEDQQAMSTEMNPHKLPEESIVVMEHFPEVRHVEVVDMTKVAPRAVKVVSNSRESFGRTALAQRLDDMIRVNFVPSRPIPVHANNEEKGGAIIYSNKPITDEEYLQHKYLAVNDAKEEVQQPIKARRKVIINLSKTENAVKREPYPPKRQVWPPTSAEDANSIKKLPRNIYFRLLNQAKLPHFPKKFRKSKVGRRKFEPSAPVTATPSRLNTVAADFTPFSMDKASKEAMGAGFRVQDPEPEVVTGKNKAEAPTQLMSQNVGVTIEVGRPVRGGPLPPQKFTSGPAKTTIAFAKGAEKSQTGVGIKFKSGDDPSSKPHVESKSTRANSQPTLIPVSVVPKSTPRLHSLATTQGKRSKLSTWTPAQKHERQRPKQHQGRPRPQRPRPHGHQQQPQQRPLNHGPHHQQIPKQSVRSGNKKPFVLRFKVPGPPLEKYQIRKHERNKHFQAPPPKPELAAPPPPSLPAAAAAAPKPDRSAQQPPPPQTFTFTVKSKNAKPVPPYRPDRPEPPIITAAAIGSADGPISNHFPEALPKPEFLRQKAEEEDAPGHAPRVDDEEEEEEEEWRSHLDDGYQAIVSRFAPIASTFVSVSKYFGL